MSSDWKSTRKFAIKALGGKCVKCGNGDSRVLQFDHITGEGFRKRDYSNNKARRVGTLSGEIVALLRKQALHTVYQLMCANCHYIKTRENKEYLPYRLRFTGQLSLDLVLPSKQKRLDL